jgi:predicted ATPase/DNA-binding SARP family transcriptional activator
MDPHRPPENPELSIRLFGTVAVERLGNPLSPIRTRREFWLLALLALRFKQPVHRSVLAGMLWPDSDEPRAFYNLRRSLSDLRHILGQDQHCITAPTPRTVQLDISGMQVDVLDFDKAVERKDAASLETAIALYRGPLLQDCSEDWATQERQTREQQYLNALETLAELALASAQPQHALLYLRKLVSQAPLRESGQRHLMRALAASGDHAALTQTYRDFRLLLHTELNSQPAPETLALYQELKGKRSSVVPKSPVDSASFVRRNLPIPLTTLFGRKPEIEAGIIHLGRCRLMTLTGMGGVGKTRLAIALADAIAEEYKDGTCFVDLAPLADPAFLAQTLVATLKIAEIPGQSLNQTLLGYLQDQHLLLILDNCEHLLPACATLTDTLLSGCPHVKILATSRQSLGIIGEVIHPVPSLSLPEEDASNLRDKNSEDLLEYAALQLFVARAQAVSPPFRFQRQNQQSVIEICRHLSGIPLAIELAAARVRALPVEQIAKRLKNQFDLLSGVNAGVLPRHQTLRATLDWSYALLPIEAQRLLRHLSVFAGGCSLEAAEATGVGNVLDGLTLLVDASLVVYEEGVESAGRYRLLETVRQYSRACLTENQESEQIRRRHRDYFLVWAEEVAPKLRGSQEAYWLEVMETEHDNLRQALAFCLEDEQGAEAGLRLGAALHWFWEIRGHMSEGRAHLAAALARDVGSEPRLARAHALRCAGVLAGSQGDYDAARSLYEESLTLYRELGDKWGIARTLQCLQRIEESLTLFREIGDKRGIADCLFFWGARIFHQGDYLSARTLLEEGLTLFRELEDKHFIALSLSQIGLIFAAQSDFDAARSLYEEGLTLFLELGNKKGIAVSLFRLGFVASCQRDYDAARSLCAESLVIFRELGDKSGIAWCLYYLGDIASHQGDYDVARALQEESLTLYREIGDKKGMGAVLNTLGFVALNQRDYDAARASLEESLFLNRESGNKLSLASSLQYLGLLAAAQHDSVGARALLEESLTLYQELGSKSNIADCLDAFAGLAHQEQQKHRAVPLWGAATALREEIGAARAPIDNERIDREIAEAMSALGEEAFTTAFAEGRAMRWEQAVAFARGEARP